MVVCVCLPLVLLVLALLFSALVANKDICIYNNLILLMAIHCLLSFPAYMFVF